MKNRILSLVLILIFCISMVLTGCKSSGGTSQDNANTEENGEESRKDGYVFGFTCLSMQNPYFITLEQSLRTSVEKAGHTMITKNPATNSDTQIAQINEMIEEGIDAIFLHPVDWVKIKPALEALKEAGVKIINVDCEVKDFDYVDAYVGSNNRLAGQICGEDLLEQRPNGGKVLILESKTQNSVNERISGFEETIAGKGFEIVARAETMGELNTAREAAYEVFLEHSDIDVVMCGNDQTALGAVVAANMAKIKNIMIYGIDGSPDLKKELEKDALIRGTCAQSPIGMGKQAAKVGIAILDGEEYQKVTYQDVFFMTAADMELYGTDGWQ